MVIEQTDGFRVSPDRTEDLSAANILYLRKSSGWNRTLIDAIIPLLDGSRYEEGYDEEGYDEGYDEGYAAGLIVAEDK